PRRRVRVPGRPIRELGRSDAIAFRRGGPGFHRSSRRSRGWPSKRAHRARGCSLRVQMLAERLRREPDPLAGEELSLAILVASLGDPRRVAIHDTDCVRKAKAILHESEEPRLTLTAIASEVGVSSIHLTQAFKRSEGVPLYRYQTQLRLGRALAELPERDDITDLA